MGKAFEVAGFYKVPSVIRKGDVEPEISRIHPIPPVQDNGFYPLFHSPRAVRFHKAPVSRSRFEEKILMDPDIALPVSELFCRISVHPERALSTAF